MMKRKISTISKRKESISFYVANIIMKKGISRQFLDFYKILLNMQSNYWKKLIVNVYPGIIIIIIPCYLFFVMKLQFFFLK